MPAMPTVVYLSLRVRHRQSPPPSCEGLVPLQGAGGHGGRVGLGVHSQDTDTTERQTCDVTASRNIESSSGSVSGLDSSEPSSSSSSLSASLAAYSRASKNSAAEEEEEAVFEEVDAVPDMQEEE